MLFTSAEAVLIRACPERQEAQSTYIAYDDPEVTCSLMVLFLGL
jgi:hypothetical protein